MSKTHPSKTRVIGRWIPTSDGLWVDPRHQTWRDPSTAPLLAHDAFHHHPRDIGTNEQEWTTLGVEVWQKGLDPQGPLFHDKVRQVASTVMQILLEPTAKNQMSSFKTSLYSPPRAPASFDAAWLGAIESGIDEVLEFEGVDLDDKLSYVSQAAGWAWHGFSRAQVCYPDPDLTRQQMLTLEKVARTCADLVRQGDLRQWIARWDQSRGVTASIQINDGSWRAATPGGQ